ncbi:Eco57I restriction-modification methylase domain-containing protein [Luteococcus peritonei]|uniref:site-specific DNA-methyltransferase (adenine-specific) n=1 Tax=Luteococcus peritonei TaxID=88874 RepID=A0ABW4RWT2_9ACTN
MSLSVAEAIRVEVLPTMKSEHGQFFTPARLAEQVVKGLRLPEQGTLRVLDIGAGAGALTAALADRACDIPGLSLDITCVELDGDVVPYLHQTVDALNARVIHGDVLELAVTGELGEDYDVVVMNPPYGKLAAASAERRAMAHLGVETPNFYAAFMAVGYLHLRECGQMAAIVPRSWANGPYFKRFRHHMLDHISIDRLQSFASRSSLFSDAKVLQENVILTGTRGAPQGDIELVFDDGEPQSVSVCRVVVPTDPERFVRIPTGAERELPGVPLSAVGLTVSTGKVVDFRSRDHLVEPGENTFPMVYQGNVHGGMVEWPREVGKPQGFVCSPEEERKYLVPAGVYVIVKRFSAKEEKRRVVAGVHVSETPVAYDNKTNVVACPDQDTAVGLALWLNSTAVDTYFRSFSGHTQVNATDLRGMPYPSLDVLRQLGSGRGVRMPSQEAIDSAVEELL